MKPHKCTERNSDGLCDCGIAYGFALAVFSELFKSGDTSNYIRLRIRDVFSEAFETFEKAEKYMGEK